MRFLGNKESLVPEIFALLARKGLVSKSLTLYDAFCGSGAVSDALKGDFRIIAGDMLTWCTTYTSGRLCGPSCTFESLGFDPFDYLNSTDTIIMGFFYNNYSLGGSRRMYFTAENAGRIDYFRSTIEEWRTDGRLTDGEYHYLLASLMESVSDVSNTAGVYGAYLKKWDPRALKPIIFHSVDFNATPSHASRMITSKVETVVDSVECDIIYIDPPYTQNQYGTQYHIFETLVLNDRPNISKITGSRPVTPMRSDWSIEFKVNILFDMIIANTKAKHILFSYNSDGFLSKDFILSSLKRYCKEETIEFIKIPYKKYRNFKTKSDDEHFEYLFYAEKKSTDSVVYESPLNYIGSKSLIIPIIRKQLPKNINTFIDLFGGGLNVGINVSAENITYNDINFFAKQIVESFKSNDTYNYLLFIRKTTKQFGLEPGNQDAYCQIRSHYNSIPFERRDPKLLFIIIMYGYQQQMRFNSQYEFNNPVGMRWFNDCVLEKMISFSRVLKTKTVVFKSIDFRETMHGVSSNAFVYMDPPYRLMLGSYNDGKRGFDGWTIDHEKQLCDYADRLDARGINFMISYVLTHEGQNNTEIKNWCDNRGYNVIEIDVTQRRRPRKEVLITNYASISN